MLNRLTFNSTLNYKNILIETKDTQSLISENICALTDRFNKFGIVVVKFIDKVDPHTVLLKLKDYFGNIVSHKRSDKDGICVISAANPLNEYLGTSNLPHTPHTDGSYQNNPPKVVAMFCEEASKYGGISILVSCKEIYNKLLKNPQIVLSTLFLKNFLIIQRDGEKAEHPMFTKYKNKLFCVFRMDSFVSIASTKHARESFVNVKKEVLKSENQFRFKLRMNHLIILDNAGILHGRTRFPDNQRRILWRATYEGLKEKQSLFNFGFDI